MSDLQLWQRVQSTLKTKAGDEAYKDWLKSLSFHGVTDGVGMLEAPSMFVRDWVLAHFREAVLDSFKECKTKISDIKITTAAPGPSDAAKTALVDDSAGGAPSKAESPQKAGALSLATPLDSRLTFDGFVVGKPNEFAYAAAKRVAECKGVPFNPLFLYGSVGLGKTHLMNAIAHQVKKIRPEARLIYLSAEKFMYHFIRALRFKDTVSFKEMLRSADFLLIDDIQFIADKNSTQEEFFHTFNALVDQKKQIILSADKSPSDLEGIEERVRSRLGWGLVADIHPTTYELRLGILQAKVRDDMVPKEVLEFLAQKITSNVRELEGALTRLVAHTTLVGRKMTIELAKDVLSDLLRACDRTVSVDLIRRYVANYFKLTDSRLLSSERTKEVAYPRQIAMFLAKEMTNRSLPDIARSFGKKDHTTVLHAVRKIDALRQTNTQLNEDIDLLRRMIQA